MGNDEQETAYEVGRYTSASRPRFVVHAALLFLRTEAGIGGGESMSPEAQAVVHIGTVCISSGCVIMPSFKSFKLAAIQDDAPVQAL